ncbi:MAG: recombinase family protein [Pseudomonadota bacterium]
MQNSKDTAAKAEEARCRAYAKDKNYQIERVFSDIASGNAADRPGLNDLLAYISANPGEDYIVIADDPSRIYRSLPALLAFRQQLADLGAKLDCISTSGLQTAEAELAEVLLAARAEWEDSVNEEEEV